MYLRIGLGLVVMFAAGIQVSEASVTSMSLAKKSINEQGVEQELVTVNCSDVKEPKVLIRVGREPWCDSQISDLCSRDKLGAAKKVCSGKYKSLLESHLADTKNGVQSKAVVKKAPSAKKTATTKPAAVKKSVAKAKPAKTANSAAELSANEIAAKQKELLDIEQQKVQIRQRQLELRKRELELQKQQVSAAEAGL